MFNLCYFYVKFAANHEISLFYEVSAKSGSNVNEAFEAFFKEIHVRVSSLKSLSLAPIMTVIMPSLQATGPVVTNEPTPNAPANGKCCRM